MMRVVVLVSLASMVGYFFPTQLVPPSAPLSPTELKYRLREKFNDNILFCGPPVGIMSVDPGKRFREFAAIRNNAEAFEAILHHNNLPRTGPWSDRDKQLVIREHNVLSAIKLDPVGGKYRFGLWVPKGATDGFNVEEPKDGPRLPENAYKVEGSIDQNGVIDISKKEPIFHTCPK